MTCSNCTARQILLEDAIKRASLKDVAVQVIKGAAEISGIKEKTGDIDLSKTKLSARKLNKAKTTPAKPVIIDADKAQE